MDGPNSYIIWQLNFRGIYVVLGVALSLFFKYRTLLILSSILIILFSGAADLSRITETDEPVKEDFLNFSLKLILYTWGPTMSLAELVICLSYFAGSFLCEIKGSE